MDNNNLGQLIFQTEQQPLDFAKKYNKLTVPLVMVGVGIIFLIPGLVDRIVSGVGFYELAGTTGDIPGIAIWIFLGLSMVYLFFCIARINKFQGFQLSVYENGANLELVKKTEQFHFDDFLWAEFTDIMKHTQYKESHAYINLKGRTLPISINEEDVPEAAQFVYELSAAYSGYIINRIQSEGVDRVSADFGPNMKLEDGNLVDNILGGAKRMPLRYVSSVEAERKTCIISGALDNGDDAHFYWGVKHLHNDELFFHIISAFTSIQDVKLSQTSAVEVDSDTSEKVKMPPSNEIEFNAGFMTSDKMQKFEQKHSLPQEKEDCLAFSAILALSNYDSPKVFKMQWVPKFIVKKGLKNMWDVTDGPSTLETLADLTAAKLSAPRANEAYAGIKQTGQPPYIYNQAKEVLVKLGYTESELDKVSTLNAWDYGRAGFIARNAAYCGFVGEEETWQYLQQAAEGARKDYNNWREYLSAYVLGRAVSYGNASEDIAQILEYLLKDESKNRLF